MNAAVASSRLALLLAAVLVAVAAPAAARTSEACANHPVRVTAHGEKTETPRDGDSGRSGACSDGHRPIVTATGIKATVRTLSRRKVVYDIAALLRAKVLSRQTLEDYGSCWPVRPGSPCACEETIDFPVLSGPEPGIAVINRALARDAQHAQRCAASDAAGVLRRADSYVIYLNASPPFVSVATMNRDDDMSANGSCHGQMSFETFATSTGKRLTVADAVDGKKMAALVDAVAAGYEIYVEAGGAYPDHAAAAREARLITNRHAGQFAAGDIYVEDGRVFLDVEGYDLSCVAGAFHPVEIPAALLKADFARALARSTIPSRPR